MSTRVSRNGKNGRIGTIPGDFNNHTRNSIGEYFSRPSDGGYSEIHEQNSEAEQSITEIHHLPVCLELIASAPVEEEVVEEIIMRPDDRSLQIRTPPGSVVRYPSLPALSESYHMPTYGVRVKARGPSVRFSTTAELSSNVSIDRSSISFRTQYRWTSEVVINYNSNSSQASSECESDSGSDSSSDSGSDSDRASISSENTSYSSEDTPTKSDSDRFSKIVTRRPSQGIAESRSQGSVERQPQAALETGRPSEGEGEEPPVSEPSPQQATTNGKKVSGKCEAMARWGGGRRIIVSIGPEGACKFRIQPRGECDYTIDPSLPIINDIETPGNWRNVKCVCGVAFKEGAGPEELKRSGSSMYVNILWDDGTKTWENGTCASKLVKRLARPLKPREYLYDEAVKAEKRCDEFIKANPNWGYSVDDE